MRYIVLICVLLISSSFNPKGRDVTASAHKSEWVKSKLESMSTDQLIGQLFMLRAHSDKGDEHIQQLIKLVKEQHIGGLCFFQGSIPKQIEYTNQLQAASEIPLLISMDAEWGLGMRLKSDGYSFPKHLTLGAVEDNKLVYDVALEIGKQMRSIGVHINFAPVVDINNNADNPVINERSFGEDKLLVTGKSFAFMQGLQDAGVIACAKHFPGHGDSNVDSHFDLPILTQSKERLKDFELFPFEQLIRAGIKSIMIAHLSVPSLDSSLNVPSSLSRSILHDLLRNELNFDHLIITDALEMKGVTKFFPPGELEVKALQAGNDILLLSEQPLIAIERIKMALINGELSIDDIKEKVERILSAKYDLHLTDNTQAQTSTIDPNQFYLKSRKLSEQVYADAITLIEADIPMLPIRNFQDKRFFHLAINGVGESFRQRIKSYIKPKFFSSSIIAKNNSIDSNLQKSITESLQKADHSFISFHSLNYTKSKQYGLTEDVIAFLNAIPDKSKVSLVVFGAPYCIKLFPDFKQIVFAYEDKDITQDLAAQCIAGAKAFKGTLPVSISDQISVRSGIKKKGLNRLAYSSPFNQGMSPTVLDSIDILAQELVEENVAPGCQIVVMRNGHIVYEKAFGFTTYADTQLVDINTQYDVASLTKILSTVPACMALQDQSKLHLNKPLSVYLPELAGTTKADITLKQVLLHQSKLFPWIPYYKNTLFYPDTFNLINWVFYSRERTDSFNIPVTEKLFLQSTYPDSIYSRILLSNIFDTMQYRYSDLGFYFIPKLIKQISGVEFEDYLNQKIYKPLELEYTCFNPLEKQFPVRHIAPTEIDRYFRHQLIQGTVHDMGSAMMGGVSGHAGLFSNAREVAKIMHVYSVFGNYGGKELISSGNFRQYTERHPPYYRRGLGFDLKDTTIADNPYISNLASDLSYGHLGFTGTCTWVDPKYNLVYVFLSNRTFPNSNNTNQLQRKRYRNRIQDLIYRSLLDQ